MKKANDQSLLLLLSPPAEVGALALYLRAVARSVGARSDAELARIMDVPTSAIANWKRRGSVSDQGRQWFVGRLIRAIGEGSSEAMPKTELGAVAAVLDVVGRAAGDPLRIGGVNAPFANAMAFGGVLALAQLVVSLLRLTEPLAGGVDDKRVPALLEEGLPQLREARQLQVFRKVD